MCIEILQEVGNLGQQAAQGETRFEVCLKMHKSAITLAESHTSKHLTADQIWERVTRNAKRGSPAFIKEINDLGEFTRLLGGKDLDGIKGIIGHQKSLMRPKTIKGEILKSIAVARLGADGQGERDFRLDFAILAYRPETP